MSPLPTISSVLCLFQGESSELNALDTAFGLARRFGAILRVLHVSTPPMTVVDPFGAAAFAGALISTEVIDRIVKDDDDMITAARRYVLAYALVHGVPVCLDEQQIAGAAGSAALFVTQEDYTCHLVDLYGRKSDVIVAAGDDSHGLSDESRILPALLDTGKAVVLVPHQTSHRPPKPVGNVFRAERVAVAWDGSLQASRALTNALPLLADVKILHLLTVRENGRMPQGTTQDAEAILRNHGITPLTMELNNARTATGESLLAAAAALNADLLIMGAYGHNRIAERLLGGTSRYVLKHAPLSVLMTH